MCRRCKKKSKKGEHYPDLWFPILAKLKNKGNFEGESKHSGFILNKAY